jgi:hypothetical protein
MSKAKFTKVPEREVRYGHLHGPAIEPGAARHDAAPVAVSVAPTKETPATDATALRTAPKPEIKTPEPRRDIGQRDRILLSDPGINRADSVPEALKIDPRETDLLGIATRQERERETRIHNAEQARRFEALKAYLTSPIRAYELDYKHRKFRGQS